MFRNFGEGAFGAKVADLKENNILCSDRCLA
jgi:hypothetical protein